MQRYMGMYMSEIAMRLMNFQDVVVAYLYS